MSTFLSPSHSVLSKFGSTSVVGLQGLISGQFVHSTTGQRPWLWMDVMNRLGESVCIIDFETKRNKCVECGEETGVLSEDQPAISYRSCRNGVLFTQSFLTRTRPSHRQQHPGQRHGIDRCGWRHPPGEESNRSCARKCAVDGSCHSMENQLSSVPSIAYQNVGSKGARKFAPLNRVV